MSHTTAYAAATVAKFVLFRIFDIMCPGVGPLIEALAAVAQQVFGFTDAAGRLLDAVSSARDFASAVGKDMRAAGGGGGGGSGGGGARGHLSAHAHRLVRIENHQWVDDANLRCRLCGVLDLLSYCCGHCSYTECSRCIERSGSRIAAHTPSCGGATFDEFPRPKSCGLCAYNAIAYERSNGFGHNLCRKGAHHEVVRHEAVNHSWIEDSVCSQCGTGLNGLRFKFWCRRGGHCKWEVCSLKCVKASGAGRVVEERRFVYDTTPNSL